MKVGIIGGGGFVGRHVVDRALDEGHQVTALIRRPDAIERSHSRLQRLVGDAFDPAALSRLVAGQEAIVTLAGPPRTPHASARYEEGARALVAAMVAAGVPRLVSVAGAAARLPGESLGFARSLLRLVLERLVIPDVIRTKDSEVAVVSASPLQWTIVRPPRIGHGAPRGRVRATDTGLAGVRIDVEDMAQFIVECLGSEAWVRRAPTVASG